MTSRTFRRQIDRINLILLVVVLVLVNLVASNLVWRVDLTRSGAYSLSRVTRETLARVEDPLRIRVYYDETVPAPYNGVRQYLVDLLAEMESVDDQLIAVERADMEDPAVRQEAARAGLQQIEIQEIRSDQFQSRAVFAGVVVLYGNAAEPVDQILAADGLEYRLTQAIRSAVAQVDILSGTSAPVTLRVVATPALAEIGIQGFAELRDDVAAIHRSVNADAFGRIEFEFLEPTETAEIEALIQEFDLTPIRWESLDGEEQIGLIEIVIQREDRLRRIPVEVYQSLFGGYALDDPTAIEDAVRSALRGLATANPRIAYSIGAGEKALGDGQTGAAPFAQLAAERYEIVPVDLADEPVPAGVETLVINGPTAAYDDAALYRIDQFLMNGGSVLAFVDRWVQEIPTQEEMFRGAQPSWRTQESGLEALLEHHGVSVTAELVLDEESFVSRGPLQQQQIFQAPVLQGRSINREHPITAGLENVIVLNATEIRTAPDGAGAADVSLVRLLDTSPRSWSVERPEAVGPWIERAPPDGDVGSRTVAVLRSGSFAAYYQQPPEATLAVRDPDPDRPAAATNVAPTPDGPGGRNVARHRVRSRGEPKLLVLSSSALTTPQLLDPRQRTPNGVLIMNALDALAGADDVALLRTKGLGVPSIEVWSPAIPQIVRVLNIGLVPALVVVFGLVMFARRRGRARAIQRRLIGTREEL